MKNANETFTQNNIFITYNSHDYTSLLEQQRILELYIYFIINK